jgi:hypothetical protein
MKVIIIILQAILNLVRKRRDLIANRNKIPPEYRDDVVVWYSPKKQRLTNYDVIESYAEDFTYWTINNTSITSAQKKIVIPAGTELKYVIAYRGFNVSTDGFDIKYTGNIAITYRYNKEDGTVGTIAINESGIYHLPASVRTQKNFGFYCNSQTVTEEVTIEQLPTSILKDFSGNGLDAYMYGFQGKLNSGVGIYAVDFTTYQGYQYAEPEFVQLTKDSKRCNKHYNSLIKDVESFNVKVDGVINETIIYYYRNEEGIEKQFIINKDGVYTVPKCYMTGTTGSSTGFTINNPNENTDITITQIPDYPNSLCYAGKQYCKAYGLPILDDYTIIARRIWFDKTDIRCLCSKYKDTTVKPGLFRFEWTVNNSEYTSSLGKDTSVTFSDSITWQTKTSYNGKALTNLSYEDGEHLIIGDYAKKIGNYYIGCHDDIIILKRSLTINEINDITEAIFNETIIEE